MRKSAFSFGYTLIELLVVISIIGLISTIGFVNYKTFSQDQGLNKAAGEIQTYLRLAQSNSTSSTLCGTIGGVLWRARIYAVSNNDSGVDIDCGSPAPDEQHPYKSLSLKNIRIAVNGISCPAFPQTCLSVDFAALSGATSIVGGSTDIAISISNSSSVTVQLTNLNGSSKSFNISKGGAVDVQDVQ